MDLVEAMFQATATLTEAGVPYALWVSREGLRSLKRMAGRAQDLADLEKLGLDRD